MSKIDEKKKLKLDALFNCSFDLFTSKGFHKTSISDIVERAGIAKGTFYLYFKDKLDIRNKLIAHKASILFRNAYEALDQQEVSDFSDQLIFVVDHIIDQLKEDKSLLSFIAKNLSWGVFKTALSTNAKPEDTDFTYVFEELIQKSPLQFRNPEVMIFMIIELAGSSCYSSILNEEPLPIDELKPYLYETIRNIIRTESTVLISN